MGLERDAAMARTSANVMNRVRRSGKWCLLVEGSLLKFQNSGWVRPSSVDIVTCRRKNRLHEASAASAGRFGKSSGLIVAQTVPPAIRRYRAVVVRFR